MTFIGRYNIYKYIAILMDAITACESGQAFVNPEP